VLVFTGVEVTVDVLTMVVVGVDVRGQKSKPGRKIKHGVGDRKGVSDGLTVPVTVNDATGVKVIVEVGVGELGVTVCVTVRVSVTVLVFTGVVVGVTVFSQNPKPGRKIKHGVGESVTVGVGVLVTFGVFVTVDVDVAVFVTVFVRVGVDVWVTVGVWVTVAVFVGVAVFVAVAVGVGVQATPVKLIVSETRSGFTLAVPSTMLLSVAPPVRNDSVVLPDAQGSTVKVAVYTRRLGLAKLPLSLPAANKTVPGVCEAGATWL